MAGWNDLPPEIRVKIIYNLDFMSRIKFSACAKTEQQLVRNNPFKLEEIEIEKPCIQLKQEGSMIKIQMTTYSCAEVWLNGKKRIILENEHPKETVKKILKSLGTKCIVGKFIFNVERGFIDMIEWFRDNLNFSPNKVEVIVTDFGCHDIEPFLNWPNNVKISLNCALYRGPLFERLDTYDKIVEFSKIGNRNSEMTDAELMKLPNARKLNLFHTTITIDGFLCWMKKWLIRDDCKNLYFLATFSTPNPFITVDEMKTRLDDFLVEYAFLKIHLFP